MATERPLDTDLVYLERDRVQYRLSWYDFTNKIGVEENDLVFIQRGLQYYSVRVGDIWDGTVLLEDTDLFLVERGIRGAFDPDNPDDPAYFPRLYHANPKIGVYIEFELTSETAAEPEVTIRAAGSLWSNGERPRIVTPAGGTHMLTDIAQDFTFQGTGVYGIMGYLKQLQISSPDIIDASLSKTELWQDMNSQDDDFGVKLFSNIGKLTGAPENLHVQNADEFCANTSFEFFGSAPFKGLKIGEDGKTTSARRAFYNTKGDPILDNMDLLFSRIDLSEMFAFSDFSGKFSYYGDDNNELVQGGELYATNLSRMFYNAANYADAFAWKHADLKLKVDNASQMFEGATAFNTDLSTSESWVTIGNMHRMFARTSFNGVWLNSGKMEFKGTDLRDCSEVFANTPFAKNVFVDLSGDIDTHPVNVEGMFRNTSAFDKNFNGSWVLNQTKSLANMFNGAVALSNPTGPVQWSLGHIENFAGMFAGSSWNQGDISEWNVSSATNMDRMFDGATRFNYDLTSWCVSGIPEEPADFADTAIFPTAKHPIWGTCPNPVKQEPIIMDSTAIDYDNGTVGNGLWIYQIGAMERPAQRIIRVWQQKRIGETEFTDLGGTLTPDYDGRQGVIYPPLESSVIRLKEIHQSDSYQEDAILFSNELAIGAYSEPRTYWIFDYTGDLDDILKVGVPFALLETYDGSNWGYIPLQDGEVPIAGTEQNLSPGRYRIETTLDQPFQYKQSTGDFATSVLTIDEASDLGAVTNMAYMFSMDGYVGQDFSWLDTSKVESIGGCFRGTDGRDLDVSNWDISNVTNMADAFGSIKEYTGTGLETWGNGPKVTITRGMFQYASKLNVNMANMKLPAVNRADEMFWGSGQVSDPPGEMFTTASHAIATQMFKECKQFDGAIGGFKMGAIRNAQDMFINCHQFSGKGFNDADWTGGSAFNMKSMFSGCHSMDGDLSVIGSNFFANCPDMRDVFRECRSLTGGSMSGWNFAACYDFSNLFYNSGLAGDIDVSGWTLNTSRDVKMNSMFEKCSDLESLPGFPQWDVSKVDNMISMLRGCSSFNQDDVGELRTARLYNMARMFENCSVFDADLSKMCVTRVTSSTRYKDFARNTPIQNVEAKHPKWGTCPDL